MIGKSKLNENDKKVLRSLSLFTCEQCGKHEEEVGNLEIHRMIRGNQGGKYLASNCKCFCKNCHKLFHPKNTK